MSSKLKFNAVDIGNQASAATIIFNVLRQAIIDGGLDDGTPLRQEEIAAQFNTSRIPVREALSRLEQEGLVNNRRYRGAVVAGISLREAEEIFNFRILMESKVIAASVPRMAAGSLKQAMTLCEEFSACKDPSLWSDLNRKFHYCLYQDSGLTYHLSVIENAFDRTERYVNTQLRLTNGVERATVEHRTILEACERGDAESAARLTGVHIASARDQLLQQLDCGGRTH
jgi:DNA-binding GntR family transcriptional regulator